MVHHSSAAPGTASNAGRAARAVRREGNLLRSLTCPLFTSRRYFFGTAKRGRSKRRFEESALTAGEPDFKKKERETKTKAVPGERWEQPAGRGHARRAVGRRVTARLAPPPLSQRRAVSQRSPPPSFLPARQSRGPRSPAGGGEPALLAGIAQQPPAACVPRAGCNSCFISGKVAVMTLCKNSYEVLGRVCC